MWSVSDAFLAAVAADSTEVVTCSVYDRETWLADLHPIDGAVTVDRTRLWRRDVKCTLADVDGTLTPSEASDLLAPYGNEIRVHRGFQLPGGDELAPLGVFRITRSNVRSGPDGVTIEVDGWDRSRRVSRNRWASPWTVAAGTDVATAITDVLADRLPDVEVALPLTGVTTPDVVFEYGEGSDPWRDVQDLARSAGFELAFDPQGAPTLYLPVDPSEAPTVATYGVGGQLVLLEVERDADDEEVYSGVIASGEGSQLVAPVQAEAWDEDTSSPTYRFGKFGQVPMFYTSPLLTTVEQCESAARSICNTKVGAVEGVQWRQLVNAAHDADDVIDAIETGTELNARLVLDQLTIPLGNDQPMTAVARSRRWAS